MLFSVLHLGDTWKCVALSYPFFFPFTICLQISLETMSEDSARRWAPRPVVLHAEAQGRGSTHYAQHHPSLVLNIYSMGHTANLEVSEAIKFTPPSVHQQEQGFPSLAQALPWEGCRALDEKRDGLPLLVYSVAPGAPETPYKSAYKQFRASFMSTRYLPAISADYAYGMAFDPSRRLCRRSGRACSQRAVEAKCSPPRQDNVLFLPLTSVDCLDL